MEDLEDLSPAGDQASSDGAIITDAAPTADEDVAQLAGNESPAVADEAPAVKLQRTATGDALPEEGEEMSSVDGFSVDALPRRAASPIDSIMSGHDDSHSMQVRQTLRVRFHRLY